MTVLQNNQQNALSSGLGGVSLQTEDRYTFTGKELDAESNLYYYDARYNSSTYSQFNSPDPMSDKLPNYNPYLYCYGNPIKFIDPDGRYGYTDNEGSYIWFDNIQTKGTFTDNKGKEWAYVTSNFSEWNEAIDIRNAVIFMLSELYPQMEHKQIEQDVVMFDGTSPLFTKEVQLKNHENYIMGWKQETNSYKCTDGSPAIACVSKVVVGNLKLKYYSKKGIDGVCEVNNAIGIVMDGWRHYFEAFMETIERIIYGDELADKDRLYDMHHWNAETVLKIKERGK